MHHAHDDIPLARRSHPHSLQARVDKRPKWFGLILLSLISCIAGALLYLASIRGPAARAPVPGFEGRLSQDGRLLGHFPYPEAKQNQLVSVSPGLSLRADAAKGFLAMQRAAAEDGIDLRLLSAFRSIELQRQLFFDVKAERNQTSLDRAKVSAPPGFSEHSTGYAIDLGDGERPQTNLSPSFIHTRAYRWLLNNAARYQFTLSFPKSNPQGVAFEPWHWRFEGSTDSLRLFEPAQRLHREKGTGSFPRATGG
jgi:D-alanyl-D-alanine carboxypeptidase